MSRTEGASHREGVKITAAEIKSDEFGTFSGNNDEEWLLKL